MLRRRSYQPELMDDPGVSEESVVGALQELDVINAWLGGASASRAGIRRLAGHVPSGRPEILDIGGGGTNLTEAMRNGAPPIKVTTLDINESVCRYRRSRNPDELVVQGDARTAEFGDSSFDIVHASLFFHHFPEDEIRVMLEKFLRVARIGVVVNDLQRSVFAYAGIAALTRLFSRNHLVRFDAPLSVRRGFTREELHSICSSLRAASFTIEPRWAYRWLVVLKK